jgi:hypothetical protein
MRFRCANGRDWERTNYNPGGSHIVWAKELSTGKVDCFGSNASVEPLGKNDGLTEDSRAIRVIKNDAYQLVEQRIKGAIDVADGVALHHLADALKEIAARFRFHTSKETAKEVAAMCPPTGERECR